MAVLQDIYNCTNCVDLVVHTATGHDGGRRIREIAALPGRVESGVVEMSDVFSDHGSGLERAGGFPPHAERFAQAGFDLVELLRSDDRPGVRRGRAA